MTQEQLRQHYRDEGWGELAEAAGYDPVNTESSARGAFRFAHEVIADKDMTIERLYAVLRLARDEWPEEGRKTSPVYGAIVSALPGA